MNTALQLLAIIVYMVFMLIIGVFYSKKASTSSKDFYLGGRSLGPWVVALSAEASDMSGWLLMGLPGVAYWIGLADAAWTAIGLAIGTYVNWLIVAKRLRNYSQVAGDAITVPQFLSNRFKEKRKYIQVIAALLCVIFFGVYAASCFVTCGKLFGTLFGFNYHSMMVIGAILVLAYTWFGGYLAVSVTSFFQAIIMILTLILVLVIGVNHAGGIENVLTNAKSIPGFWSLVANASPNVNGTFNEAVPYGVLSIASCLAWGFGYFGLPPVLIRFMSIRDASEIGRARKIANIWVLISMAAAVFIGILGRALYPNLEILNSSANAEKVLIVISQNLLPALLTGFACAGILAATMSSADSYLLITSSALIEDIYKIIKKDIPENFAMLLSRAALIIVAICSIIIAWNENSVIFTIVSFAWAGLGASFGPIMLCSLFWRRTTYAGALCGIVAGGLFVFIWKFLIKPLGGVFGIYELLPAFFIGLFVIIIVSLITKEPSSEITDEFDKVASM